jgi:peptidoglycan/xylan/chitin deacetylase (PgdA/CDA1 family)
MNPAGPCAIDINLDSLSEAYGFPAEFYDPSFFQVFDRISALANRYRIKLSIFVIGRDLENPEVFARVRDWAQMGHEVGNHTWSHPLNFGALKRTAVEEEIRKAHDLIAKCLGEEPRGFIAPNWSTCGHAVRTLIDLGYAYDTSLFPSVLLYTLLAKCALNSLRNPGKILKLLSRRDWLHPLTRPSKPHFVDRAFKRVNGPGKDRLLILPMPAPGRFSPVAWHTLGFMFGWTFARRLVSRLLAGHPAFYYLMHPADFLDQGDLDPGFRHTLERMNVPLKEKLARAEAMFELIQRSGRPVVLMRELADRFQGES